ncbi:hypothetical protein GCM10027176_19760 [Actinoallomurus bryophytorum]|uniref:hypothetical protein n=1 Tax=Actinoallomurus bryophytorum TaxID=1490222 RepID=UPI0011502667|nr:hypothetical protein [Actinoallomurus bryophytorum]
MTQDTPADLRTLRTALSVLARRLLAVAGLILAFWAFTALSQAHADVLPSHSSTTPRPLLHVKPSSPTTVRSGTHALSRTLGGLTGRTGTGTRQPVSHVIHDAGKTALGTVRRPAALVHATVPATRIRLGGLSHDLGLPRTVRLPRTAPLPSAAGAIKAAKKRATRAVHPRSPSARDDDDPGCDPSQPWRPRSPAPSAFQGPVRTQPIGEWTRRPLTRPGQTGEAGETGEGPATSPVRMKLTGAIVPDSPRDDLRPGLRTPVPVPAPVSGSGSGGDSGGKTSSSASDLPRLHLPAPGLWSVVTEPETTISRTIADKPPFSPD